MATVSLQHQNYLRYLGILGFVVLLLVVYFRKSIIQRIFQSQYLPDFSLMSTAHAQETGPKKKSP